MPGQLHVDDRAANELLVAPTMIRRMVGAQIVNVLIASEDVFTRNVGIGYAPLVCQFPELVGVPRNPAHTV